ncbi:ABC-three component system middle component 2 [Rhodococcus erythropolis]|uniref:ABC-three component system middle component 2 n=1 Tax=Rhodococcus erythropolis TaxID=1833 RepID=UPI00055C94D5|nr:ABC-three component system middle component 2 [Rhodococcus erythropolis]
MQPLNSPLELGVRSLILLTAAFPRALGLDRLVLMDYCLLHSADLGGPLSVLPAVPTRNGELGIKRSVLEHGVHVMSRAGLIDLVTAADGVSYRASEEAGPFLRLVDSPLVGELNEVADWLISEFVDLPTDEVRHRIRMISQRWTEEFTWEPNDESGPLG